MKKYLLCLLILCGSSAVFSQVPKSKDRVYTITFTDGSKFETTESVNSTNLPVSAITIYNKQATGVLFDFGEPSFSISKNTLAAISKKNRLLASQIKNKVYMGIAIRQNENDAVRIHGFRSVNNTEQLSACLNSKKICRVEAQIVLIEVKTKDKTENFALVKTMKPVDE